MDGKRIIGVTGGVGAGPGREGDVLESGDVREDLRACHADGLITRRLYLDGVFRVGLLFTGFFQAVFQRRGLQLQGGGLARGVCVKLFHQAVRDAGIGDGDFGFRDGPGSGLGDDIHLQAPAGGGLCQRRIGSVHETPQKNSLPLILCGRGKRVPGIEKTMPGIYNVEKSRKEST